MANIIAGKQLFEKVIEAIGEKDQPIKRVVIDLQLNDAVFIYVEKYGTSKLLDIDWTKDGIEIKQVE